MRLVIIISVLCLSISSHAQGTFVYDQQSADESHFLEGSSGAGPQPFGQSFTPSLSSVGFIRIYLFSSGFGPGLFSINLRSNSISGPVIGTTGSVTLPDRFGGPVDFLFTTPLNVVSNTTYYFQPVIQAGGGWGTLLDNYNYSGGTAFLSGTAVPGDLWFREGIVVPEPSSTALFLIGSAILVWRRTAVQRRKKLAQ